VDMRLPEAAESCAACQHRTFHLDGLYCVNRYRDELRSAIYAFTYQGLMHLWPNRRGCGLRRLLACVPSPASTARRQGGYNPAALLTRVCATHLKVPCLKNLMVRQRPTQAQVGLSVQNVAGAFALTSHQPAHTLDGGTILLIDDISATLNICAAPLYTCGIREVRELVLGRPDTLI